MTAGPALSYLSAGSWLVLFAGTTLWVCELYYSHSYRPRISVTEHAKTQQTYSPLLLCVFFFFGFLRTRTCLDTDARSVSASSPFHPKVLLPQKISKCLSLLSSTGALCPVRQKTSGAVRRGDLSQLALGINSFLGGFCCHACCCCCSSPLCS